MFMCCEWKVLWGFVEGTGKSLQYLEPKNLEKGRVLLYWNLAALIYWDRLLSYTGTGWVKQAIGGSGGLGSPKTIYICVPQPHVFPLNLDAEDNYIIEMNIYRY